MEAHMSHILFNYYPMIKEYQLIIYNMAIYNNEEVCKDGEKKNKGEVEGAGWQSSQKRERELDIFSALYFHWCSTSVMIMYTQ